MPVFETEARIGRIVSIDGIFDRLHILYPRLELSLRHDEVMRLNLKTGNMFAIRMKSPAWDYDWYDNNDGYPVLNIRGKVIGFSVAQAGTNWNPTIYVNVRCTLETSPPEGETTLMLRLQHLEMLNLKQYDTFSISLSEKYAKTLK